MLHDVRTSALPCKPKRIDKNLLLKGDISGMPINKYFSMFKISKVEQEGKWRSIVMLGQLTIPIVRGVCVVSIGTIFKA